MAFLVSPGVLAVEKDLSLIVPAVSSTVGGHVGFFNWGPVKKPFLLGNEKQLYQTFGGPDATTAASFFTVANFLAYSNAIWTTRAKTTGMANACSTILTGTFTVTIASPGVFTATDHGLAVNDAVELTTTGALPTGLAIDTVYYVVEVPSSSTFKLSATVAGTAITTTGTQSGTHTFTQKGVLIENEDDYNTYHANGDDNNGVIAAKFAGVKGNGIKISFADANTWNSWQYASQFQSGPGTSTYLANRGNATANDEVHAVVIDGEGKFSGVAGTILERFAFMSKCSDVKAYDGQSAYYKEVLNRSSKYVWVLDHPTTGLTSEVGEVAWGTATTTSPFKQITNTVAITFGSTGSGFSGTVTITGDAITAVAVVSGGTGYAQGYTQVTFSGTGTLATGTATVNSSGVITAINVTAGGSGYTGTPTVAVASTTGTNATAYAEVGSVGEITNVVVTAGGSGYGPNTTATIADSDSESETAAVLSVKTASGVISSISVVGAGRNYSSGLKFTLTGGDDGSTADDTDKASSLTEGYELFKNAEQYDISLLPLGHVSPVVANWVHSNVVSNRRDMVMFVSPSRVTMDVTGSAGANEFGSAIIGNTSNEVDYLKNWKRQANLPDDTASYAFCDSGFKYQFDRYNDVYRWVPLNGDIAGLCARTDYVADPWFSPGGFNRGGVKNVVRLGCNPDQTLRDELYKNNINPVVTFPNQGTILYGDKTMQSKPSAFDRVNVRRLFIVLEKAISTAAKYQLFELNDSFTRAQFKAMIEPFLRDVQGRRGLYDFKVVCDDTNNTGEVIDRNEFVADIFLKPARSINYIYLNFVATRTDAKFEELVGAV